MSLSTGVYVIYEPGVSASPILLHNVPIRDSRHCGSVHHLAPATSTPGERERERGTENQKIKRRKEGIKGRKKEMVQCTFFQSVITLCLYRTASEYSRA